MVSEKLIGSLHTLLVVFFVTAISALLFNSFHDNVVFIEFDNCESLLICALISNFKIAIVLLLLLVLVLFLSFKSKVSWVILDKEIRLIVFVSLFLLGWYFTFYDYNFFLDKWFFLDRFLLLLLIVLSVYNPYVIVFVPIYCILVSKQFSFPSFYYSYTDKRIVIDIINVTWMFIIIKKNVFEKLHNYILIIIYVAIISNWYFLAGIGKNNLNWFETNNLYYLYASTLDYGWLSFMNNTQKIMLGEFIYNNNALISIITLVLELVLPMLVFINKRISIAIFFVFIGFHISVFFLSGIFFWKWILIELAIVFCLYNNKQIWAIPNKTQIIVCYCLILVSLGFYFSKTHLSWIDSGVYNKYDFFLKSNNDKKLFKLTNSYFAPYDLIFAQNRFDFTLQDKILTGTFGSTLDTNVVNLKNDNNKLLNYINTKGEYKFNLKKMKNLVKFLRRFIKNKQEGDNLNILLPPMHIWQGENMRNKKIPISADSIIIVSSLRNAKRGLDIITIKTDTLTFSMSKKIKD